VPLSPDETLQAKTFIEAVVYRLGDGVGALAVAVGATALHLSFPSLSVISLVVAAAWIGVAIQARRGYVERLLATLRPRCDAARQPGISDAAIATSRATSGDGPGPSHAPDRRARVLDGGSSETGRMPLDRLFEPDQTTRLEILRALNTFHACHPEERVEAEPLVTVLAAEIVGLYRLFETSMQTQPDVSATRECQESVERICRLLMLISPEHDPVSAFAALQSGDARLKANALEYLENTVKPRYRRLLIPLLEFENESGLDSAT
jgi:hypothetical protein